MTTKFDGLNWVCTIQYGIVCKSGGGSGGGTSTVTQEANPPAQVLQAYQTAQNAAQTAASAPLQQYGGPQVAGFTPDQLQAFQTVAGTAGAATPYLNTASTDINNSTSPLWGGVQQFSPSAVQQYASPYTQNVLNTTMAAENNQDAQQQNQVVGNAVAQGAWGGDRSAVAQAQVAGQQAIANNATNAGLENTGYNTSLGEFNTQQQAQLGANEANSYLNSQAGFGNINLAQNAVSVPLEQANAQAATGAQEQALGQSVLNVPYEQFLQQQAYPFQTSQFLSSAAEGLGPGQGSTGSGTSTAPGASTASQAAGGLLGAGSLLGASGAFGSAGWLTALLKKGGRVHRDAGGNIPGFDPNNINMPPSVVPTANAQGTKPLPLPQMHAPQTPQSNPLQGLSGISGLSSLAKLLKPSGQPQSGPTNALDATSGALAQQSNPLDAMNLNSGEDSPDGLAFGGRAHYDDGGTISPVTGAQPAPFDASGMQQGYYQKIAQLPMDKLQELQSRMPPTTPQGQMVQKAIRQKQFMPNTGQAQAGMGTPVTPQAPTQPQAGFASGGRQHFDDGGQTLPLPDVSQDQPAPPQFTPQDMQAGFANVTASPSDAKVSPWEALAAAGFGMMAGTSPQAGVNIGRGALYGVQNLEEQKKQVASQNEQQGELGVRNKQVETEAERLADQVDQWQKDNELKGQAAQKQEAQLAETTRHNKADEANMAAGRGIQQQQLEIGKWLPVKDMFGNESFFNPTTKQYAAVPKAGAGTTGGVTPNPSAAAPAFNFNDPNAWGIK